MFSSKILSVFAASFALALSGVTLVTAAPANTELRVAPIDAGGTTTCALRAGNNVYCVGDNTFGQLGDGTTTSQSEPIYSGVSSALSVSVGSTSACAIDSTQLGVCWGDNSKGQLGNSTQGSTARRVDLNSKLIDISVGSEYTCAVTEQNQLFCWGEFANFAVPKVQHTPTQITGVVGVKSVSVGKNSVCFITSSVWCFGSLTQSDDPVQVLQTLGASQVSVGDNFACALVSGTVKCWGDNSQGQLGQANTQPVGSPVSVLGISDAVSISTGAQFACALTISTSFCWGDNSSSQIATGTVDQTTRVPVSLGSAVAITSGSNYSCALLTDANIKCVGDNSKGQSGILTSSISPLSVPSRPLVTSISAGSNTTCVIDSNSNLNCWGALIPTLSQGMKFQAVTVGNVSACAVSNDGKVYCWGSNSAGQLGDNSNRSSEVPTAVIGLSGETVTHIASGFRHFCASTQGGLVFCWGDNSKDQLGFTGSDSKTAVAVGGIGTAIDVTLGDYHSCALLASKEVICWGDNSKRQITSEITLKTAPTILKSVNNAKKISASAGNTCWILTDDTAQCIGDNSESQAPGSIAGSFSDISAGFKTVCFVRNSGGGIVCLGANNSNKLGRPGLKSATLVGIQGLQATKVSVGTDHVCALGAAGQLYCWGSNSTGQLASSFGFPSAYAAPSLAIAGKKNVGETIAVSDFGKDFGTTVEYSWYRSATVDGLFSKISNQQSNILNLTTTDNQRFFKVEVVLHKWGTSSNAYHSLAVGPISSQLRILISSVPIISGTNRVGSILRLTAGRWESGVKVSAQWYRGATAIKGATSYSYKLTAADVGKQISVWTTGIKTGLPKLVKKSVKTAKVAG